MSGAALARYTALERAHRDLARAVERARGNAALRTEAEAALAANQREMTTVYALLSESERAVLDARVAPGPPGGRKAGRVGQPRPWRAT